uniref:Retrotransposon gag domain-containing protein n=1 Tax=Chromera velia CCMP2878 TaxID=1169474 RepID=A0A0G4HUK2_9ALVE|eukprot:Cvel_8656.t1-p1 / transcript=Cvel_8656.t1 / gene=Cvel_8656 / organism=Chromera_velia_CCMP2878 / gene_product=hypothetical protein / transcript_product=hypothetical protein / location=Cvel_scaffold482:67127-82438(+) / protein_length=358 / sequence_SO=supercontig / SO=protein_coding / is_pseudo=false
MHADGWSAADYDLGKKNCIHCCQALASRLGPGVFPIPLQYMEGIDYLLSLPEWVQRVAGVASEETREARTNQIAQWRVKRELQQKVAKQFLSNPQNTVRFPDLARSVREFDESIPSFLAWQHLAIVQITSQSSRAPPSVGVVEIGTDTGPGEGSEEPERRDKSPSEGSLDMQTLCFTSTGGFRSVSPTDATGRLDDSTAIYSRGGEGGVGVTVLEAPGSTPSSSAGASTDTGPSHCASKVVELPAKLMFSSKREELQRWLKDVEDFFELNEVKELKKMKMVKGQLPAYLKEWYEKFKEEHGVFSNWESLKTELTERLKVTIERSIAQAKLQALRCTEALGVEKYNEAFSQLVGQLPHL